MEGGEKVVESAGLMLRVPPPGCCCCCCGVNTTLSTPPRSPPWCQVRCRSPTIGGFGENRLPLLLFLPPPPAPPPPIPPRCERSSPKLLLREPSKVEGMTYPRSLSRLLPRSKSPEEYEAFRSMLTPPPPPPPR